ncbi:MAG: NAD-dependent epimerase/dehydratase family protein [Myxococcales bacterium]|nr:NAD-dependent epimerase/dehydratase family protein [Myxococcales bacterium]
MNRVMVTGATTPIGRRLIERLLADPGTALVLAVGAEADPVPLAKRDPNRYRYRQVDLTRPRELHDLLYADGRELAVDVVVHNALHRRAHDEGPRIHALNVECTRDLLSLAERHPSVRRFVFRSASAVYRLDPRRSTLLGEDDPLDLSPQAPQKVRDRVEADLTVCTRMGMSSMQIVVLRCAEILAADVGSQLYDYLGSRVCLKPAGFDPMLNLLSLEDAARALELAVRGASSGVFNVPGADVLPLSRAIERWGRVPVPLPGPLLAPLYRLRARTLGSDFRYDLNYRRFHFSAVLDGRRAQRELGYEPQHRIDWPYPQSSGNQS